MKVQLDTMKEPSKVYRYNGATSDDALQGKMACVKKKDKILQDKEIKNKLILTHILLVSLPNLCKNLIKCIWKGSQGFLTS